MDISDFSSGRDPGSTQDTSLPTDCVDDDEDSVVGRVAPCSQGKPVPDLEDDDNDKDDEGSIQQQYHLEHPLQSTSTQSKVASSSSLASIHTKEWEWLIPKQQQQLLSDEIDTNSDITV